MANKFLKYIEFILLFIATFITFTPFESREIGGLFYGNYIIVLSLLMVVLILSKDRIKVNQGLIVNLFILIIIFGLYSIMGDNASYGSFFVLSLSLLFGLLFFSYVVNNVELVIKAFKIYILFNIVAIFYQFTYFFIFKDIFSFHTLVFPFSEDRGVVLSKIDLGRFSGFHNEPGTYGTWVSFAIISLMILEKKTNIVAYLGVFSLLITLSATSIVCFFIFIFIFILESIKNHNFIRLIIFLPCFLVLSYGVLFYFGLFEYFKVRFFDSNISADGTTALKILAFDHLRNADDLRFLFGSGFGVNDCYECLSLQDTGLAFNLFFYLGIFCIPVILLILKIAKPNSIYHWLAILLIFISKAAIYNCAIWALIFIIRSSKK